MSMTYEQQANCVLTSLECNSRVGFPDGRDAGDETRRFVVKSLSVFKLEYIIESAGCDHYGLNREDFVSAIAAQLREDDRQMDLECVRIEALSRIVATDIGLDPDDFVNWLQSECAQFRAAYAAYA